MKRDCLDLWEALVQLAEGKENPEARKHLESCFICHKKFQQVQRLVSGMLVEHHEPPQQLSDWAKGLMPQKSVVRMGLLRTTLSLSGARSIAADFQSIYVDQDLEIRVMYSKVAEGWEVVSKLPFSEWLPSHESAPVETNESGRFRFVVPSLDETEFQLDHAGRRLVVPSGSEAVSSGTQSSS